MITGAAGSVLRSSRQTSKPEPSGRDTSSTIRLGCADAWRRRPSAALSASTTWYPSCSQAVLTSRRAAASPSTTRICRALSDISPVFPYLHTNRFEGMLGDVAPQSADRAPCRPLQAQQLRAASRELDLPGPGVSDFLAVEL